MHENTIIFALFLIFSGAAVLSTLALYTRQSMLVAYILLGVILGPWGLKLVGDSAFVQKVGDIGIIFLLFLLGLNLHPQNLLHLFRKTIWVAAVSSVAFFVIGYAVGWFYGCTQLACFVVGAAMMFSSTIIGLKLLPTTILHHQHTGEVMISVLLLQDLIAIVVLLLLHGETGAGSTVKQLGMLLISLPVLLLVAFLFTRFVLIKLFAHFDRVREYMFLVSIAWCLGMSILASIVGLSYEIGAFIAGVTIAASPIALYIAESLKPVRDFFLVMFFFSVGAGFNLNYFTAVIIPASVLAGILIIIKPVVFRYLLQMTGEAKHVSWEVGVRLGQVSEFSLLIAYVALTNQLIAPTASYLIQATTILTFIASSYWVVLRYPTPVAVSDKLRRD